MKKPGGAPVRRPRIVVMVDNPVIGDSRMLKTADSAFNAGYDVTLLGLAKRAPAAGRHGPVPVYRVTVEAARHRGHQAATAYRQLVPDLLPASPWTPQSPPAALRRLAALGLRTAGRSTPLRSATDSWSRRLERPRLSRELREQLEFLHEGTLDEATTRTAAAEWNTSVLVDGRYRWLWPHMEDVEHAFVVALMDLDPDLVHAADRFCLVAAESYARLRHKAGRPVRWIYDAHEWIPGQTLHGGPHAKTAWLAAEHELAPRADAVITVSEELADRMRTRHRLRDRPTVVVNAPVSVRLPMDPAERRPLREEVGVAPDVPLLVYVGKLAELRGCRTVVRALALLPGVHAAFVGSPDAHIRGELQALAASAGVSERMHLLEYVPAGCVTWYIASADIGLSPLLPTAAHHAALPTKIRECLQARLPLVVSDMRAQGAFVRNHAVGAVHRPGDEQSFADAIRTVLDDLPSYRAAITDDLLAEHTWEGQERHLVELWSSLVPPAPVAGSRQVVPGELPDDLRAASHDTTAVGIIGPASTLSTALGQVLRSDGQPVDIVDPSGTPVVDTSASTGRIRASVTHWLRIQDGPRRLVYTGPTAHCPLLHASLASEVASLVATGHDVGVLVDPLTHVRPDDLFAEVPTHPLAERADDVMARYARQVRRNRRQLAELDARLLTTGLNAAGLLPAAVWLPCPVVPPPPGGRDGTTLRVLVAPGPRSRREQPFIDSLTTGFGVGTGVSVTRPSDGASVDEAMLAGHHVLVDILSLGEHTELAAQALVRGAVVVTGLRSQVAENVFTTYLEDLQIDPELVSRVLVPTDPADALDAINDVLATLKREHADGSVATADLARHIGAEVHGARAARHALERSVGPAPL